MMTLLTALCTARLSAFSTAFIPLYYAMHFNPGIVFPVGTQGQQDNRYRKQDQENSGTINDQYRISRFPVYRPFIRSSAYSPVHGVFNRAEPTGIDLSHVHMSNLF